MANDKYVSVFYPKEVWADNRELYKNVLENRSNICTKEEALEKLLFYEKFDPKKEHKRTVAQIIKIISLEKPHWNIREKRRRKHAFGEIEKLIIPNREGGSIVESIAEIDFGIVAEQISDGLESKNAQSNDYLNVQYKHEDFRGKISILNIKFLPCNYERPMLFGVLDYVAIDGEKVKENYFIHRPVFNKNTRSFVEYNCHADNKLKLLELRY